MTTTERRRPSLARDDAAPVRGAGATHLGHVRDENQDVVVVEPDIRLYAVLDGMGGGNAGDVAACVASEEIVRRVRNDHDHFSSPQVALENAIMTASAVVQVTGLQTEHCAGMGTTVVACLVIDPTRAVIAHVGDSRAYLLRAGKLAQLTRDHTMAQDLIDQGKLSPSPGKPPREANILTRVVGERGWPDVRELELQPGDRLLLCSDGLHSYTAEDEIRHVLERDEAPGAIAHELIELALRGEAPDNVSVVVIAVGDGDDKSAS